MSNDLILYEEMRVSVERCAHVDEAKDIRDKAAALAAYARQRKDPDLDVWMSEIRDRARIRIGELTLELEKATHAGPGAVLPAGGKYKQDAIAEAGISTTTAQVYEELAGGLDERAQKAGKAAAEIYFAKCRKERTPSSLKGLKAAIKEAIVVVVGPKKKREPRDTTPKNPHIGPWVDWVSAIRHISLGLENIEAVATVTPGLGPRDLREAREAMKNLTLWIEELEKYYELKTA